MKFGNGFKISLVLAVIGLALVGGVREAKADFVERRITTHQILFYPSDEHYTDYLSGNRVVWMDKTGGWWNSDIYMWDPVNGEQAICTSPGEQLRPAISGDRVVWQDYRNGNPDIYMWDPVNGEQAVCTNPARQGQPSISGDRIVWADERSGRYLWDIYMWDPVNGEQQITTDSNIQTRPSISGDKIVWQDYRNDVGTKNSDIYMWDPVNGEQAICTNPSVQLRPAISGDKIVWKDNRSGNWVLYMWDPVDGEEAVCTHPSEPWMASISGDRIVWYDWRNGNPDIYMWDPVNGEQAVCTHPAEQRMPSISGDTIAWLDNRFGDDRHWDIYVTTIPEPMRYPIDIKPGSCPNPLNVKSKSVLPVAVLGTEELDVNAIDAVSVRLNGVSAIRHSYEDVATAVPDVNDCNCITEGADGYLDLTLKFKTQEIVESLGDVNDGDVLTLLLEGVLTDETAIEGSDCIIIKRKDKPLRENVKPLRRLKLRKWK